MKVFILITGNSVVGVYTDKNQMILDFSTTYSDTELDRVEIWNTDGSFIKTMKVSKKTTITIED